MSDRLQQPSAERLNLVEQIHDRSVADPYRWLEDATDPRTLAWSAAHDALFAGHAEAWACRPALRDGLARLLSVGSVAPPVWRAGRPFFTRREPGAEHPALWTVDPDGDERMLVDPMLLDPAGTTTLDYWVPSWDGTLLAYNISRGGTEDGELWVIDVATGDAVDGPIDRVRYSDIAWLPSSDAFYVARELSPDEAAAADGRGEQWRLHRRVYLHRVGTGTDHDVLIFGEGAKPGRYFQLKISPDGRWLVLGERQGTDPRNDLWIADLTTSSPTAPDLRVLQRDRDAQTWPSFHGGRLYLRTNHDAPRGRICVVAPEEATEHGWRELVAEDPEAVLEDFAVLDGARLARPVLVLSYTRHAVSELVVHDLDTAERIATITLPGLGSVEALSADPAGGHEAWLSYTDFATPATVLRLDASSLSLSEWARPPGAADHAPIPTRQVTYRSTDGTPVRMFVIGETGGSGPRPTVLYGYGGFNIPLTPWYSALIATWVAAGGVYAVANLRGGSEEGEQWHRAGMLANKQNVFDDFHAAADWLVDNGVTTPDRLGISGGSNGGLLVGAALTQRPQRYAAVVCSAPLLDMIRYERFGLGPLWVGEYGTVADPEQFGWLLGYSPYHNVRDGADYPAVLFTVFDGDTRVDPLHARKLAAALAHATRNRSVTDAPGRVRRGLVLLRRERDVGHAGRAVSRTVELGADQLAFLAVATGLAGDEPR